MKCKRCRRAEAAVDLPSHHAAFCPGCFFLFFRRLLALLVAFEAVKIFLGGQELANLNILFRYTLGINKNIGPLLLIYRAEIPYQAQNLFISKGKGWHPYLKPGPHGNGLH